MSEIDELRAEVERMTTLNERLARQVVAVADTLESGRRELLATGWDAACDRAATDLTDAAPEYGGALKEDNPYRKPAPVFTGGDA